jgi:HEPN domain-containing protein
MIEFHDAWILKAQSDLRLAEVAIRQDDPILDGAIFHAQQCAEKALKGFLAYNQSEIRKTHNLVWLIDQCAALDPAFNSLLFDAKFLKPKATEFRYFDGLDEVEDVSQLFPTVEEVEEAIVKAKRILDFVQSKLPKK